MSIVWFNVDINVKLSIKDDQNSTNLWYAFSLAFDAYSPSCDVLALFIYLIIWWTGLFCWSTSQYHRHDRIESDP